MKWSDDRCEELGRLIDEGLGGTEAAARMDVSRAVVTMKATRLGWKFGTPRTDEQKQRPFKNLNLRKDAGMVPVHLRLDADTYAQVVKRARKQGVPRTAVIRDLIEWGLLDAA